MRVISGSARRTLLKTVQGLETRPTTDRIKETLFNIIQSSLYDCRFLDLFSGSGGIGIEALSRGAKKCWFVENNAEAAGCIRENLKATHLEDRAVLMECDVTAAIQKLRAEKYTFDFIFMDPPYEKKLEFYVLDELRNTELADEHTMIIVEASKHTAFDYLEELGYETVRVKEYKTNLHIFIRKCEGICSRHLS